MLYPTEAIVPLQRAPLAGEERWAMSDGRKAEIPLVDGRRGARQDSNEARARIAMISIMVTNASPNEPDSTTARKQPAERDCSWAEHILPHTPGQQSQ